MSDATELLAHGCPEGHYTYPGHDRCPECAREQTTTVDLSQRTGEVVTWTESTATPSGVRSPNTLAIVAFTVAGTTVRAIGGTTDAVTVGATVEPIAVTALRDPDAAVREPASQSYAGYRFRPVRHG